jgi:hypothetical protein
MRFFRTTYQECFSSRLPIALIGSLVLLIPLAGQAQQTPSSQGAGAAPAGGGAGGSYESVVLEYQASAESASWIDAAVASAINFTKHPDANVIIATNADIGAIVQLEAVLGQANLIGSRLDQLKNALKTSSFPCYSPVREAKPARVARMRSLNIAGFLESTGPAGIQTLVQTIATVGAVTESVAPAPGGLNDTSLINLIANGLTQRLPQGNVYVPSMYPPALINHSFGSWSLIGTSIGKLEESRKNLYAAADAKILSKQCQYTIKDSKGNPTKYNQATINQITAEVTAASSLVDTFETSLFGGQAPPSTAQSGGSGTPAAGGPGSTSAQAQSALASAPSGTTLQQLLYADLLLRRLGATPEQPVLDPSKPYYLISVHSLESGGNTLTKSNQLAGGHLFFSGTAVSTFSLFKPDGSTICSGISYGYRGFVAEDRMTAAINDQQPGNASSPTSSDKLPGTNHFTTSCVSG